MAELSAEEREAIAEKWLQQCGPCDAGLPMGCTHPDEDYRPVIAALLDDLAAAAVVAEDARAALARVEALLPDDCWITRTSMRCTDFIGGTIGASGVFAEEMCCLPCRIRAALLPVGQREEVAGDERH